MAAVAPGTRTITPRTAVLVASSLVLGAIALRLADPQRVAWVRTYLVIFGSLLIQALPFVMLGALAASLVEVFVPIGTLERLGRLPRPLQLPAAALAGLAFPICECGSVPVARRLAQRGLMPSAAVTFMLAAPVINPVVIASTFVAYRSRSTLWTMVGGRFVLGLIVAIRASTRRVNISGRVSTSLTGRPTTRAASAARIVWGETRRPAPNAPPTNGTRGARAAVHQRDLAEEVARDEPAGCPCRGTTGRTGRARQAHIGDRARAPRSATRA